LEFLNLLSEVQFFKTFYFGSRSLDEYEAHRQCDTAKMGVTRKIGEIVNLSSSQITDRIDYLNYTRLTRSPVGSAIEEADLLIRRLNDSCREIYESVTLKDERVGYPRTRLGELRCREVAEESARLSLIAAYELASRYFRPKLAMNDIGFMTDPIDDSEPSQRELYDSQWDNLGLMKQRIQRFFEES